MACLGGLGIGLTIVFGCFVLAFGAEVYYLLWRKKRIIATPTSPETESPAYTHYAKELFVQLIFRKKPSSEQQSPTQSHSGDGTTPDSKECCKDVELGAGNDSVKNQFSGEEESVESELMRLHNLSGPPRFLFTISEETKEDLESNDGRSRKGSRTRSLSDLILTLDSTPSLTPLQSPPLKLSSLSSTNVHLDSYNNPLFESRPPSSPPPTFKFLRDAEEKLYRRLKEEAEAKLREMERQKVTAPSGSSQVLPLEYSPAALRPTPPDKKTAVR